jgi:O-phosphoseryl-tRNA synthetase
MNLGLGVERLAMIAYQSDDIRRLSFPQFFPIDLTDFEIARAVTFREEPASPAGKLLARAITSAGEAHGSEPGPCSFLASESEIEGRHVRVYVEEPESGTKLLGPACMNRIYVHAGSVLGVPNTDKWKEVRESGVDCGITYLSAVAALAAARIEQAARCGQSVTVQVKMAKLPSDINIRIEEHAMRFITDQKKKVDLRGPVFLTVRSELDR